MATSYEVTDGTRILGTFSSQAKADALKKELKAEGVAARVRAVHGETSKPATKAPAKKPAKAKPVKTSAKPKKKPVKTRTAPSKHRTIDYSRCDTEELIEGLQTVQLVLPGVGLWTDKETGRPLQEFDYAQLKAAIEDGKGLNAVCNAFLNCPLTEYPKSWDGWVWEKSLIPVTYEEWKFIEKRLTAMMAEDSRKASKKPAKAPAKTKAKTKATSKPKKAAKKKGPADIVIDPDGDNDATYLFDNGFIGQFVDESEIDWDDWDDDVAGVMYVNFYGPNGEFEEGDEHGYREGMTLGELCKEEGLPQPVTKILDEFYEALEDGNDPKKVFKALDAYLTGNYPDGLIVHVLHQECKRDVSKNLRRRR